MASGQRAEDALMRCMNVAHGHMKATEIPGLDEGCGPLPITSPSQFVTAEWKSPSAKVAYWQLMIQSREEQIAHLQRQVDHLRKRIAEEG